MKTKMRINYIVKKSRNEIEIIDITSTASCALTSLQKLHANTKTTRKKFNNFYWIFHVDMMKRVLDSLTKAVKFIQN